MSNGKQPRHHWDCNFDPRTDSNWLTCDCGLAELEQDRERLRELFQYLAHEVWRAGDVDGGDFQDKAEGLGLLVLVPGDEDFLAEWGPDEKMFTWAWSQNAIDAARKKSK